MKIVLFLILIILLFYILHTYVFNVTEEYMTPITVESNEAIQSMANIFNSSNSTISNLKITGILDAVKQAQVTSPLINITDGTNTKFSLSNASSDYLSVKNASGANSMTLGQGGDAYFTGGVYTPSINAPNANISGQLTADNMTSKNDILANGRTMFNARDSNNTYYWGYGIDGNDEVQLWKQVNNRGTKIMTIDPKNTNIQLGSVTSNNKIAARGADGGIQFYDRQSQDKNYEWLSQNGVAKLYSSFNGQYPTSIDSNGNLSSNGNIVIKGMITVNNNNPWGPIYFKLTNENIDRVQGPSCISNDSNNKISVQKIISNDDSVYWYWYGRRLINKKTGLCLTDMGRGGIPDCTPYNQSDQSQLWKSDGSGATDYVGGSRFRLWNVKTGIQLWGSPDNLATDNRSDRNQDYLDWYFHVVA